jgi:hypothetical protein
MMALVRFDNADRSRLFSLGGDGYYLIPWLRPDAIDLSRVDGMGFPALELVPPPGVEPGFTA